MSEKYKLQLQFINDFYKILFNLKRSGEIDYILTLAEDEFKFSAPEVVDYCYKIIYNYVKLEIDGIDKYT